MNALPVDLFRVMSSFLTWQEFARTSQVSRPLRRAVQAILNDSILYLIHHPKTLCGRKFAILNNFRPDRYEKPLLLQKTFQKALKIITQNAARLHINVPPILSAPSIQAFRTINDFDEKCQDEKERLMLRLIRNPAQAQRSIYYLRNTQFLSTISEENLNALFNGAAVLGLVEHLNVLINSASFDRISNLDAVCQNAAAAGQINSLQILFASRRGAKTSFPQALLKAVPEAADLDDLTISELSVITIKASAIGDTACFSRIFDRGSEISLTVRNQAFIAAVKNKQLGPIGLMLGNWSFSDAEKIFAAKIALNHNYFALAHLLFYQCSLWSRLTSDIIRFIDLSETSEFYKLEGTTIEVFSE